MKADNIARTDDLPNMVSAAPDICIAVLAHNEEGRIATCLNSLADQDEGASVHILVNGSSDRTAEIAGTFAAKRINWHLHDWPQGGKSRSWNRFVFDTIDRLSAVHVFIDGDAVIAPGSIAALAQCLDEDDHAHIVAGMPLNGRGKDHYRRMIKEERGLFGDLYAVRGEFLKRMRAADIRLPEDLIGDDGLLCAMAKCDLGSERQWDDMRVGYSEQAGFCCEPFQATRPASWGVQYKRMVSYSVRHFQNQIISTIMRDSGATALPRQLSSLYRDHIDRFRPRRDPLSYWFDRRALARMRAVSE